MSIWPHLIERLCVEKTSRKGGRGGGGGLGPFGLTWPPQ